MTHRKTAITVPEDILEEVDRSARERGESRSRFISRVLRLAVRARRDAEVTRRLDALFADESVRVSSVGPLNRGVRAGVKVGKRCMADPPLEGPMATSALDTDMPI